MKETVQLALYRRYGFQPCKKDIKILKVSSAPVFPEIIDVEINGYFYTIYKNVFNSLSVGD